MNTSFDWASWPLVLKAASGVTAIALIGTVLLLLRIMQLRTRYLNRLATEAVVLEHWRPLLLKVIMGEILNPLPVPQTNEREPLLILWNQLQDGLRGTAKNPLFSLAWQLNFHDHAWGLVAKKNTDQRMLGLATLGHLAQPQDWERFLPIVKEPDALISLAAARALLKADGIRAVPIIIEQYLAHQNWPAARVATVLRNANPESITLALVKIIQSLPSEQQVRLVPLTRLADGQGQRVISILLACSDHPGVLAASLALAQGPVSYKRILELTHHSNSQVRAYAAKALSNTSAINDEQTTQQTLFRLLSDSQWAVRHRAAQTVVAQPLFDDIHLQAWLTQLKDPFAKDILIHAFAQVRENHDAREISRAAPVTGAAALVGAV